jgi:LacI family transcriptional regulator
VVNEHPSVDPKTRERVQRVIREQDYHPNSAARALARRRSQIVGLMIPQSMASVFADPYFPILIQGVSSACEERGYYMVLSFASTHSPVDLGRIVHDAQLDGLIVASALLEDAFVTRLVEENFPFVLIGRSVAHSNITTVDADNKQGVIMAVQHLAREGYTRIATITGPLSVVAGADRRDGYLAGLQICGLPSLPCYIQEGDWSEPSGATAMDALLRLPEPPDAVFVASDSMASGALKALRRAGLRCPHDMALIGFDDIPLAAALEPPLTTVRQPIFRLGHTAAGVLIDALLRAPDCETTLGQRIVLGTELVVRESCGQARRIGPYTS